MSKFERVLSDAEIISATFKAEAEGAMAELRAVEQAVLEKLAGQEPVMYARTYNGEVDWDEACVTEANDGVLLCDQSSFDDDGNVVVLEGYAVIPLYAHPIPSKPYSIDKDEAGIRELVASAITGTIHAGLEGGETPPIGHWLSEFYDYGAAYEHIQTQLQKNEAVCISCATNKAACVSESAESDTQRHLSYLKRYQKWRRGEDKTMDEAGLTPKQIGEALDWLITFAENHIEEELGMAGKAACVSEKAESESQKYTVRCNDCWWHGGEDDLDLAVAADYPEDGVCNVCPQCKKNGCLMDLDPNEQQMSLTKEHQRTAKNHIPDTGKMVFDPDAALTLAERTLNIEITEPLADELIQFARKLHEKYAQADHIADMRKKVPDGWQLVPKEPTIEMYDAWLDGKERNYWNDVYKAMLAAAPKYTGESK